MVRENMPNKSKKISRIPPMTIFFLFN